MSISAKIILPAVFLGACAFGQQTGSTMGQTPASVPPPSAAPASGATAGPGAASPTVVTAVPPTAPPAAAPRPAYTLHPEDEITVRSQQIKEIGERAFRLDQSGEANLPLIGRVHLAGDTVQQAEKDITEKLKTFYRDPDVAVTITAYHEEPVSVLGAVTTPGIHPIHGQTTLLDVISSAGGVRGDAGSVVKVTRDSSLYGAIPYPTAHSLGIKTSVVDLDLKGLMNSQDDNENIIIQPHDVVSVPPAQLVYVIGNVKHAGSIPLGGKPDLTVLQAVSLAEGLDPKAAGNRARILRRESDTNPAAQRTDIPVDISAILKGKAPDILLRPNDVLYVPSSTSKAVTQRSIEAAIAIATGVLIVGKM